MTNSPLDRPVFNIRDLNLENDLPSMGPGAIRRVDLNDLHREVSIVKRGEAIASVRNLEDTVDNLNRTVATLTAKLSRCEDRLRMVSEDRTHWRREAESFRTALIELASDMHNVGLLTQRASETRLRVAAIIDNTDAAGTSEPPREAGETLRILEELARPQEETTQTPLPPVSYEGAQTDAGDDGLVRGENEER